MDGIHDLGGREGFGPIAVDEKEDPFHEPWEGRVRGMVKAMRAPPDWSLDWFRHCRELIAPVDYLTRPYFDQWLQAYCAMLVLSGVATVEEIVSGHSRSPARGLPAPRSAADVAGDRSGSRRYDREIDRAPRYASGAEVRARLHGTRGHTRLPGYARGRRGRVEAHHGAHVLPDANAIGEKCWEHLYTVGFDAAELWSEAASSRDRVFIDLWESYLEDA